MVTSSDDGTEDIARPDVSNMGNADCPNKGAGKGLSSGSGAPCSGLAFGPSQPSPSEAAGSRLPTEAVHRGGDLPPWASDDLFFDPPSSIFASLGTYDHPPIEDPWITHDPWTAAARRNQESYTGLLFGPQPPQPSGHSLAGEAIRPNLLDKHRSAPIRSFSRAWTICAPSATKESSMNSMSAGSPAATCFTQHAGRERNVIITHRP